MNNLKRILQAIFPHFLSCFLALSLYFCSLSLSLFPTPFLPLLQHSVSLLLRRRCLCSLKDMAFSLRPASGCSVRSS